MVSAPRVRATQRDDCAGCAVLRMMTLVPVGGSGPAGDWVNSRTDVPSIHVWHAMVPPSATMMPRVIFRSSKAARIDAKYAVSPA